MHTGRWSGRACKLRFCCAMAVFFWGGAAHSQQVPDTSFRPPIANPAFPPGEGPVVAVDAGHTNFHTADDRYLPFADLLLRDGYVVRSSYLVFTEQSLREPRILVISNALNPRNASN